jgi:hypothetical protein
VYQVSTVPPDSVAHAASGSTSAKPAAIARLRVRRRTVTPLSGCGVISQVNGYTLARSSAP